MKEKNTEKATTSSVKELSSVENGEKMKKFKVSSPYLTVMSSKVVLKITNVSKVNTDIKMEIFTKVNGKMILNKETVNFIFKMAKNTKECSSKDLNMVKESTHGKMVIDMKDNLNLIKEMV